MSDQSILITGVNGFIGSHIARLLKKRWRVVGIDTNSIDLHGTTDRYCQLMLPDTDIEGILRREQPSACLHFAGSASVGHSLEYPSHDFQAGPVTLFHLLDAIRKTTPDCSVFFPSSAAVYGNPKALPISEDSPTAPISPYGYHKLMSEQVLQEFSSIYGLNCVTLRIFSCYGPGLKKQLLWDVCSKIRQRHLHLFGTGDETRDFIHVDDVARSVEHLLNQQINNGLFNLASGKQTSVKRIAQLLCEAWPQSDIAPVFNGNSRPGDPLYWQADVSRLAQSGFEPRTPLEQGIAEYAAWYQRQDHDAE
ncbi:NAD-dependent epimerase/dehydratase family protein [Desulfovibrio ferrophilus]|uniref:NAD-dependent epimerase/dehydratase n=1 Tax=Desulfovibrio ferrophilus TaxID=241368 RepID=A0A2Z6B1I6_9BACT|nr:NAD-dependent epimerase/dehydratase family protein [Desulfovibrio ferrophilus]BBD09300.1 NAD-dependent epimerase/dehydratase [Desulfovibrio ferrophilus]